jgi:hypothetical protein
VLRAPTRAALAAFVHRDERCALLTQVERELHGQASAAVSEREL